MHARRVLASIVAAIVAGVFGVVGFAQDTNAPLFPADAPTVAVIEFRARPHVVLHAWARSDHEAAPQGIDAEAFAQLRLALRAVADSAGGERMLGIVDARVAGAGDAAEFVGVAASMPERQRLRSGEEVGLRDPLVAYATALQGCVQTWTDGAGWPAAEAEIAGAQADIGAMFEGASGDPVGFIAQSMGWTRWDGSVPVDLVLHAPEPGGVTFRGIGGAMCMVGMSGFDGSMRAEVVVHEVMHAIDVGVADESNPLARLRAAMIRRGVGPEQAAHRDAWHTVFFVQAGEAVRRTIDPAHRDYGEVFGYYERVGPIASAVRNAWAGYLAGDHSIDETVDAIADAAAAGN